MNLNRFMNLSVEDVTMAMDVQNLAKEALEVSNFISSLQLFKIGQKEVEMWRDGECYESLSYDGVWKVRQKRYSYEVECTPDGIFKIFKAKYLFDKKKHELDKELLDAAVACQYFKNFLERIKKLDEKGKLTTMDGNTLGKY